MTNTLSKGVVSTGRTTLSANCPQYGQHQNQVNNYCKMHRTKRSKIVYSPKKMRPKIRNNFKNGTHLVIREYIKSTKISSNGS